MAIIIGFVLHDTGRRSAAYRRQNFFFNTIPLVAHPIGRVSLGVIRVRVRVRVSYRVRVRVSFRVSWRLRRRIVTSTFG